MPDPQSTKGAGPFPASADRALSYVLLICLLVYIFSAKGYLQIGDTVLSLETAEAAVTRGQLDVPYVEGFTFKAPDGRSYSKFGVGLPIYFLPLVAVSNAVSKMSRALSATQSYPTIHASVPLLAGFLISFANIPFVLLTLFVFALLLRHFGVPARRALLLVLGLGLGTLAWRYAVCDWSEGMQMGLLMVAVYGAIRRTTRTLLLGGVGFAWLVLVKLIYAPYFAVVAIYLLTRPGGWRHRIKSVGLFALPGVPAGALLLWLDLRRFGNALESGYGSEAHQFFPQQLWHTIPQLLFSLDKGLFILCPLLLAGLFGWKQFFRLRRPEALLCGAMLAMNLLISGSWYSWANAVALAPRWLVPIIPLWLLPAAFAFRSWQPRREFAVLSLLVLASLLVQIPGILVSGLQITTIRDAFFTPGEQTSSRDYSMALTMLKHKLVIGNEIYHPEEFNAQGSGELDLTSHQSMVGLDLWTEHTARQLNKPVLRWLPVPGLLIVGFLAIQLAKGLRSACLAEPSEPEAESNLTPT